MRSHVLRVLRRAVSLVALVAAPFAEARATPTTVLPNIAEPDLMGDWNLVPPSMPGHEGILGYLYGWDNLTRIDDSGGDLSDRWWSFTSGGVATPRVMFAQNQFDFGYLDRTSGFHSILTYGGASGYLNLSSRRFTSSDPLSRFALFTIRGPFVSAQAQDPMVTFQITGNASQYGRDYSHNDVGSFVVAWEDLPLSFSDRDYNDFVLELSGVRLAQQPANPVPEPTSVVLFASGLAAMWHVRRRRERQPRPGQP